MLEGVGVVGVAAAVDGVAVVLCLELRVVLALSGCR